MDMNTAIEFCQMLPFMAVNTNTTLLLVARQINARERFIKILLQAGSDLKVLFKQHTHAIVRVVWFEWIAKELVVHIYVDFSRLFAWEVIANATD